MALTEAQKSASLGE